MASDRDTRPEIESFNLTDMDVSALDVRLELTTLVPHGIRICYGNCSVDCNTNIGCNCDAYN